MPHIAVAAQGYFEIDVDIHTWGNAALSAFNTVKEKLASLLVRAGVVIEASADDEMPERILAGTFLTHLDPAQAMPIAPELAAYLSDATNHVPPLNRTKSDARPSREACGEGSDNLDSGGVSRETSPPPPSPSARGEMVAPSSRSECGSAMLSPLDHPPASAWPPLIAAAAPPVAVTSPTLSVVVAASSAAAAASPRGAAAASPQNADAAPPIAAESRAAAASSLGSAPSRVAIPSSAAASSAAPAVMPVPATAAARPAVASSAATASLPVGGVTAPQPAAAPFADGAAPTPPNEVQ